MLKESVDWPEQDEVLRTQAAKGMSAAEIALIIPNATRSAVLGRARRIGVTIAGRALAREPERAARRREAEAKRREEEKRKAEERAKAAPPPPPPKVIERPAPKPVAGCPFEVPAGAHPITIDDLRGLGRCRWPYDVGTPDGETLYCGEAEADRSFCAKHYCMAYTPSKPKETKRWR